MILILYTAIVFMATMVGAVAGIGGGVIIKPLLDLVGFHDLKFIALLSTLAVITMATTSIIKNGKAIKDIEISKFIYLVAGSMVGGFLGSSLFQWLLLVLSEQLVLMIQSILMFMMLLSLLILLRVKDRIVVSINCKIPMICTGILLGLMSTFLGIGGGPFNVVVFVSFMKMNIKQATLYSIMLILFSQTMSLFLSFDEMLVLIPEFDLLLCVLGSSVVGGFIGTELNKRMNEHNIHCLFKWIIIGLMLVCLFNILKMFVL